MPEYRVTLKTLIQKAKRHNCSDNEESGIFIGNSENIIIKSNLLSQNSIGIETFLSTNCTLSLNNISDCQDGIRVYSSDFIIISQNLLERNEIGILMRESNDISLIDNVFAENIEDIKENNPLSWDSIAIGSGIAFIFVMLIIWLKKNNRYYLKLEK